MILDFQPLRDGRITVDELVAGLTRDDLRDLTCEMISTIMELIHDCVDGDVVFQPVDPQADDPYAATPEELAMPWTLGHVIVHITASAEESAAIAAELARGVPFHGRSRYEVPWQEVRTIEDCRHRLHESLRMRLASLDMWPDKPHEDNAYQAWSDGPQVNPAGRFVLGLLHSDNHLEQIKDVVGQAREAREARA